MSITTLTLENIYSELADLSRDQGIDNRESWDELIDEVVEGHLDLGELDLDQDTEGMKELLRARWPAFQKERAIETAGEDEVVEEVDPLVEPKVDEEDIDELKTEEEDY